VNDDSVFLNLALFQYIFGSGRFEKTYWSRNVVVGKQYVSTERKASEEQIGNKTSFIVENRTSIALSSSHFIIPTEIFRLLSQVIILYKLQRILY